MINRLVTLGQRSNGTERLNRLVIVGDERVNGLVVVGKRG